MFRLRSSCVTNPSTRVPIGSPLLFTSTHEFLSNLMTDPSARWISFLVSTTTALTTWPCSTFPLLLVFFTEHVMMSPMLATFPFVLIHSTWRTNGRTSASERASERQGVESGAE